MGNCFSDPSEKHKGGGQKLGSSPAARSGASTSNRPPNGPGYGAAGSTTAQSPPRTLGGGGGTVGAAGGKGVDDGLDPRERALKAAEQRAQTASKKGVTSSNPKSGQLAAKLAAERKATSPTQNNNERMMDAGDWN